MSSFYLCVKLGILLPDDINLIPRDFYNRLEKVKTYEIYQIFMSNQLIGNINEISIDCYNKIRILKTNTEIDQYIAYISSSLNIDDLCTLSILAHESINISKLIILDILKKHITKTGKESYIWLQLASKTDFSHYKFSKRKWPFSNTNSIEIQLLGRRIGVHDNVYLFGGEIVQEDAIYKREYKQINDVKRSEWLEDIKISSNYNLYEQPNIHHINTNSQYTKQTLENICKTFLIFERDDLAVLFICTLMTTAKYFHNILHSQYIMETLKILMKKHIRIYKLVKYAMNYSMYLLLKEERITGKNIHDDSRVIFTGDEFRSLPVFDQCMDTSPYLSDTFGLNSVRKNTIFHLEGDRRFTNNEEYQERLYIVSGGMLNGIILKDFDAIFTGSCNAVCVATNPLEQNFTDCKNSFQEYLNNYYPSYNSIRDIQNDFEAIEEKRLSNMESMNEDDFKIAENTHIEYIKKILESTTEPVEYLDRIYYLYYRSESKLSDIDIGISAITHRSYTEKVYGIFEKIKNNLQRINGRPAEVRLYKKSLKYGFKWVMKGKDAARPIDFFKININNPALMHRFHLNIVKFWWDGIELRALASGICAALTGINQFYNIFSSVQDPISIVLKNAQRGYTTLLNVEEIEALKRYIRVIDKYRYIEEHLVIGKISRNHTLFSHNGGIRYELPTIQNYIKKYENERCIFHKQNILIKRLNCLLQKTKNGTIVPPVVHMFEAICDDLMGD